MKKKISLITLVITIVVVIILAAVIIALGGNDPIIPVGFRAVDTKDAVWNTDNGWRNGIVIEDEDGNQFVWIPVYNLSDIDNFTNRDFWIFYR